MTRALSTSPLRSDHSALSLHCVTLGTYNKDYEENASAQHFPKFAPLRSANFS